jgi:hypothetical protein
MGARVPAGAGPAALRAVPDLTATAPIVVAPSPPRAGGSLRRRPPARPSAPDPAPRAAITPADGLPAGDLGWIHASTPRNPSRRNGHGGSRIRMRSPVAAPLAEQRKVESGSPSGQDGTAVEQQVGDLSWRGGRGADLRVFHLRRPRPAPRAGLPGAARARPRRRCHGGLRRQRPASSGQVPGRRRLVRAVRRDLRPPLRLRPRPGQPRGAVDHRAGVPPRRG